MKVQLSFTSSITSNLGDLLLGKSERNVLVALDETITLTGFLRIANINEARQLWIETAYEAGDDIPLPSTDETYSGKLLLRMPKSLHRRLAEEAEGENVSLNQYIVSVLSRG